MSDYFAMHEECPQIPWIPIVYVLRDDKRIKIGKTSKWSQRWLVYCQHNPDIRFIAAWPESACDEDRTLFEARQIADNLGKAAGRRNSEWFPATPALLEWANEKARTYGRWWDEGLESRLQEASDKFHQKRFSGLFDEPAEPKGKKKR